MGNESESHDLLPAATSIATQSGIATDNKPRSPLEAANKQLWCDLALMAIDLADARAGLRGLLTPDHLALGDPDALLAGRQAFRERRAEIVDFTIFLAIDPAPTPLVTSAEDLLETCHRLSRHLSEIDRWEKYRRTFPVDKRLSAGRPLADYDATGLVLSVWAVMRCLPGRKRPKTPATRLGAIEGIRKLEAVVAWCEERCDNQSPLSPAIDFTRTPAVPIAHVDSQPKETEEQPAVITPKLEAIGPDGWDFPDGGYSYRGRVHQLTGKERDVLMVLVQATRRASRLTIEGIEEAWRLDPEDPNPYMPSPGRIRGVLSNLNARLIKDHELSDDAQVIQQRGRGRRNAVWWLDMNGKVKAKNAVIRPTRQAKNKRSQAKNKRSPIR